MVTLHGKGFAVPCEDGEMIRGFYAFRKVAAPSPAEARQRAEEILRSEERVRGFIDATHRNLGEQDTWSIRADTTRELSFLGALFYRMPKAFIFYQEEEAEANQRVDPTSVSAPRNPRGFSED